MTSVLVVAPHPDDETLGCGGTLLRHVAAGDAVHWLVLAALPAAGGTLPPGIFDKVAEAYGFAGVHRLELPDAGLDTVPLGDLIPRIGAVVQGVAPTTVYLPHPGDAHTDHRVAFDAAVACTKPFRYPSVRRVLVYETPSETDFGLDPDRGGFRPNVYVDVTAHLERKLEVLRLYAGEMGVHPFPRNEDAIRARAILHGSVAGAPAAEAFMLLREIL